MYELKEHEYACFAANEEKTKRIVDIPKHSFRGDYQRDRMGIFRNICQVGF